MYILILIPEIHNHFGFIKVKKKKTFKMSFATFVKILLWIFF